MSKDSSISTPHLEKALFTLERKRHITAEIVNRLLDMDRLNEFISQCKTAPAHYHPLLIPLCLFGFTLIPQSDEWLRDRDSLVMFMLWKVNEA